MRCNFPYVFRCICMSRQSSATWWKRTSSANHFSHSARARSPISFARGLNCSNKGWYPGNIFFRDKYGERIPVNTFIRDPVITYDYTGPSHLHGFIKPDAPWTASTRTKTERCVGDRIGIPLPEFFLFCRSPVITDPVAFVRTVQYKDVWAVELKESFPHWMRIARTHKGGQILSRANRWAVVNKGIFRHEIKAGPCVLCCIIFLMQRRIYSAQNRPDVVC